MSVPAFYDDLAGDYHRILGDWRAAVREHGEQLDEVVRDALGSGARRVLDCSCGIGTQAVGLALRGHRVLATDLSAGAVARAAQEACSFGTALGVAVADMRRLPVAPGSFDVVLSAGNSVAHLLTEADLRAAAREWRAAIVPGGLVAVHTRDYDAALAQRPTGTPPVWSDGADGARHLVVQAWEWDGPAYTMRMFRLAERPDGGWDVAADTTRMRAWRRSELAAVLADADFEALRWEEPDLARLGNEPLVTARAPGGARGAA